MVRLVTSGNTDQLVYHLGDGKDNGATEEELIAAITGKSHQR